MKNRLARIWSVVSPDYIVVSILFMVLGYATLINWPHFALDSRYYYAMALHFGGHSEVDSRDMVIALMQQLGLTAPMPELSQLFHWGMVEPRVVLPLLATPFVALWGFKGFLLLEVILTYCFVILLMSFLARIYGRAEAFVVALLVLTSHYIMYFSMSLLTEPLTMLIAVLMLICARQFILSGSKSVLFVLAALVILQGFTRQATFVSALAFLCAWLGALVMRRPHRAWGAIALVVGATAIALQVIQSLIWPFSQLDQFLATTSSSSLAEAIVKLPSVAWNIFYQDLQTFFRGDLVLVAIIVLTVSAVILFWRRTEAHLILGAFIGIALYNVTNGTTTQFRYSLPALPFYVLGISLLLAYLVNRTRTRPTYPNVGFEIPSDEKRSS